MVSIESALAKEQVLTALVFDPEARTIVIGTDDVAFASQTVLVKIRAV